MNINEKCKYKSLKFYSSDEWMAGATKRYRKVFETSEVKYIWCEFAFYNKFFDEKEWSAKINFKSFSLTSGSKKELCSLDTDRTVKTDENIVYVRDGWGSEKTGSFWKKGEYCWEAYIDGVLIGSEKFFIEDKGRVSLTSNPYFTVDSVKLFSADFDYPDYSGRQYLVAFKRSETKYIWVEFNVEVLITDGFYAEIFFNFYDDAGQLKAQTNYFEKIAPGAVGRKLRLDVGWGNKNPGSWKDDNYFLEIVFMDTLLATVPFDVGEENVEGIGEVVSANRSGLTEKKSLPEKDEKSIDEFLEEINQLIGLQDVKKKIHSHIKYLDFLNIRKEKGFEDSEKISLHSVFTGNPGTGKTTIVRLLGKLYKSMGLLSKGHVVEVGRAELVAEFIGQTAPKVKEQIKLARGGVLFIDEAYALFRGEDSKDFGHEVIEILLKEMSDGPGDIAIMVAGYPREMQAFLKSNPGLKSRFNHYFHFSDYLPEELLQISEVACKKRNVTLSDSAKNYLEKIITDKYRDRDNTFGNARFVFSLIDEAKINMGIRLMQHPDVKNLDIEILSQIEQVDVEQIFELHKKKVADIPVDEPLLAIAMGELNVLTGMKNIKQEINDLVKLIRYYREIGKDVLNKFSMHIVFTGNPGTGKTTLARIMGKVYKSLGLLEKGHLVECDREALVAGYIGQTAIKTNELISQAKGGVLFIDEAYSLVNLGANDFGNEAVEILLKRMEDLKGELSVIVAGYPAEMNRFLESNPGLKSRFNEHFYFNDFSADELLSIAISMLAKEGLTPDASTLEFLKSYFEAAEASANKYFGNARFVRNTIEEAVKNQNLRMAGIPSASRTNEMIHTLIFDDVKNFNIIAPKEKRLGFKN